MWAVTAPDMKILMARNISLALPAWSVKKDSDSKMRDEARLADEAQSWDASFCCKTDYELPEKIKAIIPDVV